MSDENLAKAPRTLWHIPTVAGAVVVSYNLPGDPTLKLDGPTLAGIFLGKITKWNDPAIAGQNPGRRPCPIRTSSWSTAPTGAARPTSSPTT